MAIDNWCTYLRL